jgi:hypothetical protein
MAIRILKDLVAGVSEDQKLAVVNSGVLSDLHHLLQKPPEQASNETLKSTSQGDSVVSASEKTDADVDNQPMPASESHHEPQVPDIVPNSTTAPEHSTPSDVSEVQDDPAAPSENKEPVSPEFSEPLVDHNVIRQPVHAVPVPTGIDRAIELRDSAFAILDAIATNASDNGMEIIGDSYVQAGIHISLVDLLKYAQIRQLHVLDFLLTPLFLGNRPTIQLSLGMTIAIVFLF